MLYDNALLARAYVHGWLLSRDERLKRTCEETLEWMAREMVAPEGGFYSALDATPRASRAGSTCGRSRGCARRSIRPDAEAAIAWFGATEQGNFEGTNVLESRGPEPDADTRQRIRERLYAGALGPGVAGPRRQAPGAWNGLAISAFAEAGAVLDREDLLDVARRAADFVLTQMVDEDGRLLRTFNDGRRAAERVPRGPRLPARRPCSSSTRRRSRSGGSPTPAASPTRSSSASPTPSTAASSRRRPTTSSSSPGARTSRTTRSPPAGPARRSGCCAWPR
jgi:hypothetical protein